MYEINDYQDYIAFLSKWRYLHGGMTEQAIVEMLRSNALTERFGITISDVKKDISSLPTTNFKDVPIMTLQGGTPGKIKDKQYEFLLAEWAKNSYRLTVKKMEDLIQSNHLNVSVADVVADIREYNANRQNKAMGTVQQSTYMVHKNASTTKGKVDSKVSVNKIEDIDEYIKRLKDFSVKLKDRAFLDSSITQFANENGLAEKCGSFRDEIRKDIVMVNSGGNPISIIASSFVNKKKEYINGLPDDFKEKLVTVIKTYSDRVLNRSIFRGILWDCFPGNKREINILVQLLELGISGEIERGQKIDDMLINRYARRLSNEYGIEFVRAKEITQIFCVAYGKQNG